MTKIAPISPVIRSFIDLERKKEEVKEYYESLNKATEAVVAEIGVGTYFQDPTDGTVYQVVVPEGRFVTYEKYGFIRTKRDGETRGSLSVKKAEEIGLKVK